MSYSQEFESSTISRLKRNGNRWSVKKAPARPRADGSAGRAARPIASQSKKNVAAKLECLKKTFVWSDAQAGITFSKAPAVLKNSKDKLHHISEYLINEVGLEPGYVATGWQCSVMPWRAGIGPGTTVSTFLRQLGCCYYNEVQVTEKAFVQKFIDPHKEVVTHLVEG